MTRCDVCFTQVKPWELWKLPLPGRTMNLCQTCAKATKRWLEAWEQANKAKAEQRAEDILAKARGKG